MRRKSSPISRSFRLAACLAILAVLFVPARSAAAKSCDRECLRGFITQYLNAMVVHNPRALPVAPNARFTENSRVLELGDGLWQTVSGLGAYRQDILDVSWQTAASQVVVEESGKPVLFVLRLKVDKGKVSEIETMVTRSQKEGALFNPDGLQQADKAMAFIPPHSQLSSRQEAVKIALNYPAGLKVGSFVLVDAPFAPDAYRIENGVHTAGPGCARAGCENIKTQNIIKHPGITTRVIAVDQSLGLVLLRMDFGSIPKAYGPGNALAVWEVFKIYGGQIHAINASLRMMPADAGSGWDAPGAAQSLSRDASSLGSGGRR
jgi:hypothetical protein